MLLRSASFVLAAGLALGAPAALAAPAAPAAAAHVTARHAAPAPAPSARDAARYARRERQAPGAASFEGGNAVAIGLSGAALGVVLVLVLVAA